MAEMNLRQIVDKLNSEFTGEVRKLVFWYDTNAEFEEDIDTIELENAKVLYLKPDNQFYIKHFLEREDSTTNYLIYAPFAKPDIRNNHLADTILYSKEFFADRASLIALDLGIDNKYVELLNHYITFFKNKDRYNKFKNLGIENYNKDIIEVGLMSVLSKSRAANFEEVLRTVLLDDLIDNNYLTEFEKFGLLEAFWEQVEKIFGYFDSKPTLQKLMTMMFITATSRCIDTDLPKAWEQNLSYKSSNIIVFLDNYMHNVLYSQRYDEISSEIYQLINGKAHFEKMDTSALINCNLFLGLDILIVNNLISRLENEDIGAKYGNLTIPELCVLRRNNHFGKELSNEYSVLENAYYIIAGGKYHSVKGIKNLIKNYMDSEYKIDTRYRYFYYHYDKIQNGSRFEKLRYLVENIYTNQYLNPIIVNWNKEFTDVDGETGLTRQKDFFAKYINYFGSRVVVIISDALRYEVAYSLYEKLQADAKCEAKINTLQGVLPSYTPLGMASLLPHNKLEFNSSYEVLIDDRPCATTLEREAILQSYKEHSKCVKFDDIRNMKTEDLRSIFTGQEVVYVYHNQIDARGDNPATENEVFTACAEAIDEVYKLILKISSQANTTHFIVTSDHGFIYKRNRLQTTDKIKGATAKTNNVGQRHTIGDKGLAVEGVCSITVGKVLNNDDQRVISFPLGPDIFKVPGAGQNYVHGGSSPQEMLIPVIDIRVEKGKVETSKAEIELVSQMTKITNLITILDFMQTEPVSDIVKEAKYRVYFISENNEKISNENIIIADKKDKDAVDRMFRLRFSFKNKQYDKTQKYYLVIYEEESNMEKYRREIIMDIAFADDFGFFG